MKEKITIVIPIFNPDKIFFKKMINSLNNQNYKNFKILLLDDYSNNFNFYKIKKLISTSINKIPFKIKRNNINIGSNKSFGKLLEMVDTHYVAFADQDDVWHPDKLKKSIDMLKKKNVKMVCSDVNIIDQNDKKISNSISKVYKTVNLSPKNMLKQLLYHNFVIGCTVVTETEFAKKTLPFFNSMNHDQQLGIYAALHNNLYIINEPLIDYRIHGGNQTSTLKNIKTKKDYFEKHIMRDYQRYKDLKNKYSFSELDEAFKICNARIMMFKSHKITNEFKSLKNIDKRTYYFERYFIKIPFILEIINLLKLINKFKH